MNTEWEYKVRDNPYSSSTADEFMGYLDEYGRNGWELCGITDAGWLIFKREKRA